MTWNRELYPSNWQDLARACKERANWKCEQCGMAHGSELVGRKRGNRYKVRLTAAHLDHDPENPEPRLIALCEACHLRYDRFLHGRNARRTKYRKQIEAMKVAGQLELFSSETRLV